MPMIHGEANCEAIDMEMIFYFHACKTHWKGFVHSLVLKMRIFGTRKWRISPRVR